VTEARNERRRLKRLYPDAFKDGLLVGVGIREGPREPGGYPKGFHQWDLDKRNAWWAGANTGYLRKHPREEAGDAEVS
jgi:hypothetical protein